MKRNIFDAMADYSINEGMDSLLLQNEEYIKSLIVDRLLSAYTESGSVCGKMAYRQDFQDCAALLLEKKLLKVA